MGYHCCVGADALERVHRCVRMTAVLNYAVVCMQDHRTAEPTRLVCFDCASTAWLLHVRCWVQTCIARPDNMNASTRTTIPRVASCRVTSCYMQLDMRELSSGSSWATAALRTLRISAAAL